LRRIRHPRESGGPFKALKNMDSRLRGNDNMKKCTSEGVSNKLTPKHKTGR